MTELEEHLRNLSRQRMLPKDHVIYLESLKAEGFMPKVIYDLGACVLHWTNEAKRIWPDATYVLFDAFDKAEFLYKESGDMYHVGVLSDRDDRDITFYQHDYYPGGNSYYREIGCPLNLYPVGSGRPRRSITIDTIVKRLGFPLPDLVKMDTQGSENDIINGGHKTLAHAQHMILELQHTNYNDGAPKSHEVIQSIMPLGWKCVAPLFCKNSDIDGDYGFVRIHDDII
jgi:FkbM family methyltransferase